MLNQKSYGSRLKSAPYDYLPTDRELTEEIYQLFYDHPHIDSGNISVSVTNGEVTLTGSVPHRSMQYLAEVLVHDLPGVIRVKNGLDCLPHEVKKNPDRLLATAVRGQLADKVAHPGSLEVSAENGRITIQGVAFDKDVDQILKTAAEVPGVLKVKNKLDVLTSGQSPLSADPQHTNQFGYQPEFIQGHWSPIIRSLGVVGGIFLLAQGIRQKGAGRLSLVATGLGFLARAITNRDITHLIGTVIMPVLNLRRTITVSAPVEDVFEFWKNFSNYPKFMSYIQSVNVNEHGGLRWVAIGPARSRVEWNTALSQFDNQVIAWKSIPGSLIATEGKVYMHSTPEGGTRLDIQLSYAPPLGALGYAVAHFLGFDPRSKIDEDLLVMKMLIERKALSTAVLSI